MSGAIYVRISSDPEGRRAGVQRQREECLKLANRLGIDATRVYEDNDRSAMKGNRPAFQSMLAEIRAGGVTHLIAWSQDRVARQIAEWEQVVELCGQQRMMLATVTDGMFDLATPGGRMNTRFRSVMATGEVEVAKERIRSAARQRALNGKALSAAGYGFRRVRDITASGSITGWRDEVDEGEAENVRWMVAEVLAGKGISTIAKELTRRGVPTPRGNAWSTTAVRKLLGNPRIVGDRVHNGELIGPTEAGPIIDRETWERLQTILTDPQRRTLTNNTTRWMLTGVGRCGVCGGRVSVRTGRYTCIASAHVAPKVGLIDQWVSHVIAWGLSDPHAMDVLTAGDDTARDLRLEIADIHGRLAEARQMAVQGDLSIASLSTLEHGLSARLEGAESRLRASANDWEDVADLAGYKDAHTRFTAMDVMRQRRILAAIVEVRLHPRGRGRKGFDRENVEVVWKVPELDPIRTSEHQIVG